MNTPRFHGTSFDYLRLFASLLVIFGHAHALTGQTGPGFAANGVQTIGLKIFFALSGYLVTLSWVADPHVPRFLARRSLRIFPALAGVVLLSVLVAGPILTTLPLREYLSHPFTWSYFQNIALNIHYSLPGVFSGNVYPHAVNGSLWSLPVEFAMYIAGPALVVLTAAGWTKRGPILFCAATVLVAAISIYLLRLRPAPAPLVIYGTNVWFILELAPYFLIGGAFAILQFDRQFHLGVALIGVLALAMFPLPAVLQEIALYIVLPYTCITLGRSAVPGIGGVARFGDLSYGLFLYSFPVQQVLVQMIGVRGGAWLNFVLAALISAVFAFLSWRLIEKPALSFKPRQRSALR